MSSLKKDGAQLLERVANAQQYRHERLATRDHVKAHAATVILEDLLADAEHQVLREALRQATDPDRTAVPVVPGPADQARVVSLDLARTLLDRYAHTVVAWAREGDTHSPACNRTYADLWAAIEALGEAAFVNDVAAFQAQSEGRPS